jgi:glycosyltransferase involved in cell wall biosynthesis
MNAFGVGGTIRTTLETAGELAKRHDVEVASIVRRQDEPALPVPPGVRLVTLSDLREDELGPVSRRLAERPTLLMTKTDFRHKVFNLFSDANLLRYLASARHGVLIGTRPSINVAIARLAAPSVVRVGQDHMNFATYNDALKAQIRAVYPRLDLVSTLTEGDAADYRKALRGRTRVECMPNGVPDTGGLRASLDEKVVVAAGRVTRQKGFDRLLPAWAAIAPQHPDWELRIFGDGSKMGALRRQVERLGIEDSAKLMGFTPRLHEEFARSSLYVMSSRREGFPMVLLEAMAVGLPVVSFDCPTGPADIIREGVDGHVVPNGDKDALARALSDLMGDGAKRRSFGAAALEGASRYELGTIARRWEELFAELAAGKPADAPTTIVRPALTLLSRKAAALARRG